ncbi:MAG: TadE/TadG family type IV pilus assembly protein [Gemmataceae bacterium]
MARIHRSKRPAAYSVESAIILPVTLFLLIGLVVGALGVFNYQEVAFLTREGARYASTHGAQWRSDTGLPPGTSTDWTQDIITNGINPRRMNLDPSRVNVTVAWPPVVNQPDHPDNWPGSKVRVTVSYTWIPTNFLTGSYTLTSTSELPVTN